MGAGRNRYVRTENCWEGQVVEESWRVQAEQLGTEAAPGQSKLEEVEAPVAAACR